MKVACPNCSFEFEYNRKKNRAGTGAHYADKIKKLSPGHRLILECLKRTGVPVEISEVYRLQGNLAMEWKRRPLKPWSVSGRLSELQGLGCVAGGSGKIELKEEESMQFRFANVREQKYAVTERGLRILANGGIVVS